MEKALDAWAHWNSVMWAWSACHWCLFRTSFSYPRFLQERKAYSLANRRMNEALAAWAYFVFCDVGLECLSLVPVPHLTLVPEASAGTEGVDTRWQCWRLEALATGNLP